MANPAQLQRQAKDLIARNGRLVTVSWPAAKSGLGGGLNGKTVTTPPPITVRAFIYSKDLRTENGAVVRETRALFPATSRSLTGAKIVTKSGETYLVKSVTVTAPNDVVVLQEAVLT